jgi:glycosyltransferase involved in cell wall biosynthesis
MKDVLIVTYYFPPAGGPGSQRVLKFARYLPRYGYRPLVLTVPEDAAFPTRDPSLLAEAPPPDRIVRVPIPEFYAAYRRLSGTRSQAPMDIQAASGSGTGLRDRVLRWLRGALFIPDGRMAWVPAATRAGVEICGRHPVAAIVASGPPFTTHWIGRRIAERAKLPLVLDYRDPWTEAPFYPSRPWFARALDRRLEHTCLRRAARIATASRTIARDAQARYPDIDPGAFAVVSNGYDPVDFEGLSPSPGPEWTLSHTGSIFAARIPRTFLTALRSWLEEDPERARTVRIRFAGRMDDAMKTLLDEPPLRDVVRHEGFLPHRRSLQLLLDSHLLLLLVVADPMAGGMVTAKVFEYLGSGTPILALAPEGEAADLIRATRGGHVVAPDDGEGIRQALDAAYAAYRSGERAFGAADPEAVASLTRHAQTGTLARLLDEAIGEG